MAVRPNVQSEYCLRDVNTIRLLVDARRVNYCVFIRNDKSLKEHELCNMPHLEQVPSEIILTISFELKPLGNIKHEFLFSCKD